MEADGQRSSQSEDGVHVWIVVRERLNHGYTLKVVTICVIKGERLRRNGVGVFISYELQWKPPRPNKSPIRGLEERIRIKHVRVFLVAFSSYLFQLETLSKPSGERK